MERESFRPKSALGHSVVDKGPGIDSDDEFEDEQHLGHGMEEMASNLRMHSSRADSRTRDRIRLNRPGTAPAIRKDAAIAPESTSEERFNAEDLENLIDYTESPGAGNDEGSSSSDRDDNAIGEYSNRMDVKIVKSPRVISPVGSDAGGILNETGLESARLEGSLEQNETSCDFEDTVDPDDVVEEREMVAWKQHEMHLRRKHPNRLHFEILTKKSWSPSAPYNHRRIHVPDCGLRYRMSVHSSPEILRVMLEGAGFRRGPRTHQFDLLWLPGPVPLKRFESLKRQQRVNHFPKTSELARKDKLYHNLKRMKHLHGRAEYGFLPETFMMPAERDALQAAFFRNKESLSTQSGSNHNLWIVKPLHSSQGRGVFVTNQWRKIPTQSHILVSRYIADPMLLDNKKADLRVYALITSYGRQCIHSSLLHTNEDPKNGIL